MNVCISMFGLLNLLSDSEQVYNTIKIAILKGSQSCWFREIKTALAWFIELRGNSYHLLSLKSFAKLEDRGKF